MKNIFHNPAPTCFGWLLRTWTYKYQDLFTAPEGDDQPTARPVSLVTGEHMDVQSGH
ncbi:MAG: hypothetical protein R2829_12740 [Bacteroidia bacterium]